MGTKVSSCEGPGAEDWELKRGSRGVGAEEREQRSESVRYGGGHCPVSSQSEEYKHICEDGVLKSHFIFNFIITLLLNP